MELVYLSDSVIPSRTANSVHVMKMCRAFVNNGHRVSLFVPDVKNRDLSEVDVFKFYGVDESFEIIRLPWPRFKGRQYYYALKSALKARKLAPDLAFGRFMPACYLSAVMGLPVVYETHGMELYAHALHLSLYRRLCSHPGLKRQIVISEAQKKLYESRFAKGADLTYVAHDGADLPSPRTVPAQLTPDRLHAGYIGHLYRGRGIEIIIEMARACPWADFHIIGGDESSVREWRAACRGLNNLIFHGFLPPSETETFRLAFDVLLAPYQRELGISGNKGVSTSAWMSPLKIFEYMAAGKAVISSDLPVLREILRNEENALLCNPENTDEWIAALNLLSKNKDLRLRLGERARSDLAAHYTWEKRARDVLAGLHQS